MNMNDDITDINSSENVLKRRLKNNLIYSGVSYMVFGAWSVVRILMSLTMTSGVYEYISEGIDRDTFSDTGIKMVFATIIAVLLLLIALFHLYIGTGAVRYAKGRKMRKLYPVVVLASAIFLASSLPDYFGEVEVYGPDTGENTFAAFLVDLTVLFILIDILYSIIRLKMLKSSSSKGNMGTDNAG